MQEQPEFGTKEKGEYGEVNELEMSKLKNLKSRLIYEQTKRNGEIFENIIENRNIKMETCIFYVISVLSYGFI